MGNLLKEIFNDNQAKNFLKIKFKNVEALKKARENLKKYGRSEFSIEEAGVYSGNENNVVPLLTIENANGTIYKRYEKIFCIPEPFNEDIKYRVKITGGSDNPCIQFNSVENSILKSDLEYSREKESLHIEYKATPWNGKSIDQLISHYVAFLSFLAFVNMDSPLSEINEENGADFFASCYTWFFRALRFFLQCRAVFNELQLTVEQQFFKSLEDEDLFKEIQEDISVIYWSLIKNQPLRLEGRIQSLNAQVKWHQKKQASNFWDEKITLTNCDKVDFKLGSALFSLKRGWIFFNTRVKKIIKGKENRDKVIYGDTDSEPMYAVLKLYRSDDTINSDQIIEYEAEYRNAQTIAYHNENEIEAVGWDLVKLFESYGIDYKPVNLNEIIFAKPDRETE